MLNAAQSKMDKMTVGIVGLGLIGGSMAIDLRRRGFASEILGVEAEPVNASAALNIGLADEIVDLEQCIDRSDIVVLSVPVGTAVKMLPMVLDRFAETLPESDPADVSSGARCKKIVIDVCSTKASLVEAVRNHPARRRYVATHPMAGTEYSGPWAAQPGLFDGRACIICNGDDSDKDAVEAIEALYDCLNMRLTSMDASAHDVHTAYVSHISHITSFALALTVLDKEKDEKHIFDLASGGFSSTVRLAKSNADMWIPILSQNRDNVLKVMDTYIEKMNEFRDAISSGDEKRIRELIGEANRIKRILR